MLPRIIQSYTSTGFYRGRDISDPGALVQEDSRPGAAPHKTQRGGDGVQDAAPATKKKGGIAEAAKKLIGRKK